MIGEDDLDVRDRFAAGENQRDVEQAASVGDDILQHPPFRSRAQAKLTRTEQVGQHESAVRLHATRTKKDTSGCKTRIDGYRFDVDDGVGRER